MDSSLRHERILTDILSEEQQKDGMEMRKFCDEKTKSVAFF
jgi:hypothetical protein